MQACRKHSVGNGLSIHIGKPFWRNIVNKNFFESPHLVFQGAVFLIGFITGQCLFNNFRKQAGFARHHFCDCFASICKYQRRACLSYWARCGFGNGVAAFFCFSANTGYQGGNREKVSDVSMVVGNIRKNDFPEPKTSGIKMRGTGAATKGLMSRGPMA